MIDSVLPHPFPPRPREVPEKPDIRSGIDGFAQSVKTAGSVVPPSPAQAPKRGQAIVKPPAETVSSLLNPVDQSDSSVVDGASTAAEQFNQSGFFGNPPTREPDREVQTGASEVAPLRLASEIEDSALPSPTEDWIDGPKPSLLASDMPSTLPAAQVQRLPGQSNAVAARDGIQARPVPQNEVPEAVESIHSPARRAFLREPTARSPIQVALHELEQGIQVSARTDGLDEAERARLHDEIAALLARHGLAPRAIRINAPLRSPLQQENS